jgi:hypothetical protein
MSKEELQDYFLKRLSENAINIQECAFILEKIGIIFNVNDEGTLWWKSIDKDTGITFINAITESIFNTNLVCSVKRDNFFNQGNYQDKTLLCQDEDFMPWDVLKRLHGEKIMLSETDNKKLKELAQPFLKFTKQFHKLMVIQLVRNIKKKGKSVAGRESWLKRNLLEHDFHRQVRQFQNALSEVKGAKEVWLKAADVANYAMMLADKHEKSLEEGLKPQKDESAFWTDEQKKSFEELFTN